MDDVQNLTDLVGKHAWVPAAALVIGLLIRLCKPDTIFPVNIPPKARWWAAMMLGGISAVLQKKMTNLTWPQAIVGGLFSFALAVTAHSGVIGSMRNGKEFVVPFMTKPGVPPGPGKPPSIPPPDDPGPDNVGIGTGVEVGGEETPVTKKKEVSPSELEGDKK